MAVDVLLDNLLARHVAGTVPAGLIPPDPTLVPERAESSATDAHGRAQLAGSDSIADVVLSLAEQDGCWIRIDDPVSPWGYVDKRQLNGVVFRAWLFGVLTALELAMKKDLISKAYWREVLSEQRLDKARHLKAERQRRGQVVDTINCLQFADLSQAAVREDRWFNWFGFASRKKAKKVLKQLESLRNNLAHSQDIIQYDWEIILRLALNAEQLRELPMAEVQKELTRRLQQIEAERP